jgi:hypothetical protein
MRLEFGIELSEIEIPRFSVEAVEGIGKLFTLATLILNVLEVKSRVEVVFHGLNPEDPTRKIAGFREIVESAASNNDVTFASGSAGQVAGSSSYYQWLVILRD